MGNLICNKCGNVPVDCHCNPFALGPVAGLRTAGELTDAFAKLPRDTIVWGSSPVHGGTCYSECAIYPPGGKRDVALLELSKPVEWGIIT